MIRIDPAPAAPSLPPLGAGRARLWLPKPRLASCLRAVVSRDTRGLALDDEQRHNHFPASPICAIVWYLSGTCDLLEPGRPAGSDGPRLPLPAPISFFGPFTRPMISWNPGPMRAIMLLLLPDALSVLTGIDPGAYLDRVVPAAAVFDAEWMAMCAAVAAAADDEQRLALIESFLDARWQPARPDALSPIRYYSDWSQSLALRAATSDWGRSLRQVERRIKQWTGQPLRELQGMARSERAFFAALLSARDGSVNWSDVADLSGYSDQSHLCRQTRRITGFPPEELRRRIHADESFWVYRLWGFSENGQGLGL